ncbi:hypothetical protein [Gelidibacter sp.]|uniref:hypothetical protein n=1 Tax=Gelidibacter sp. TaxID=2018083 RepID=UPI003266607A
MPRPQVFAKVATKITPNDIDNIYAKTEIKNALSPIIDRLNTSTFVIPYSLFDIKSHRLFKITLGVI